MTMKIEVKLDTKKLQMLRPKTKEESLLLMDRFSFRLAAWAQRYVPVDTGATRASVYVRGIWKGANKLAFDVAKALSAAMAKVSGRRNDIYWTDPVEPKDEFERIIGASTWYAERVEFRNRSFLRRALLKIKPDFLKGWERIFDWTR